MALSCMLFVSVYAFYRYIRRPTPLRLALLAVAVGLALVAKQSGVFQYLVLGMLAIAELLLRSARTDADTSRARSFARAAASLVIPLLVTAAASYILLWAFYGFRCSARPAGLQMPPALDVFAADIPSKLERVAIFFCARHHLLPRHTSLAGRTSCKSQAFASPIFSANSISAASGSCFLF
jgi:hypothetical protein